MADAPPASRERDALAAGIVWLLIDMTLVTGVNVLVKIEGQDRPAVQLVFIRALIGLIAILPLIWRHRADFRTMRHPGRNTVRVTCNALALSLNFAAITMLPLAVVNAVGFTRPLVAMTLAALFLGEHIRRLQWLGAGVALAGVVLLARPESSGLGPLPTAGLAAAGLSIFFGAMATVQTRALRDESAIVMMVFYTVGLVVLTGPPALIFWAPVGREDLVLLLAIGLVAQLAQYCFLRAYRSAEASLLAPLSYLSIVLATAAGWMVFDERPGPGFFLGGIVVIAGVFLVWRAGQRR